MGQFAAYQKESAKLIATESLVSGQTQSLNNSLRYFGIPDKYFIFAHVKRVKAKFVISSKTEIGGLNSHSRFMTYDEMNSYLQGYNAHFKSPLI